MKRIFKLFNYPTTPKRRDQILMLKIVLASRSPRRKKLLSQLGLTFDVIPSDTEEIITSNVPAEVVLELSGQKAEDISKKIDNAFVIGADTIVVFQGTILGKPTSSDNAAQMLHTLSDNVHSVFTGVTVMKKISGRIVNTLSFVEETKVYFSALSSDEIEAYIETGSPMDKAGAYGIQDDWGAVFVNRVEGDFYNVVGLPLNRFYQEMKTHEPDLLTQREFSV